MIIVPSGDTDKEKILLNRVSEFENVTKVTGLSTTEIKDGYTLTQEITPKELSELVGIDYSACKLLYQLYGVKHEQYQSIFSDTSDYRISIMHLFEFVHEQSELGVINLGEKTARRNVRNSHRREGADARRKLQSYAVSVQRRTGQRRNI